MKNNFRKLIYFTLGVASKILKMQNPYILVLCYHGFSDKKWRFNVNIDDFIYQINHLKKNYQFINVEQLNDYLNGKRNIDKPSILITIDDGYRDLLSIVDFLKLNNIRPIVFLLGDVNRINHNELGNYKELLTEKDILRLKNIGWNFGSHSATHSDFYLLTDKEVIREINGSKISLERQLNMHIEYFAFPKGRYTQKILNQIKSSGYKMSFTMNDEIINENTNKFLIPRIGVDSTHGKIEFKYIYSPLSISFRRFVKKYFNQLAI